MTTRRTLLRGIGCTIALPWLESMPAFGATTAAAPKRLAVMFMGNGINGNHWWAKGSGAEMKLSRSLEPLEPVKKKINVINGLFNQPAVGKGIHPGQTGNLLSGVPIQKGAIVRGGITFDQVLAKQIGQDTAQSSLVLAIEQPMTGYHETNFSMAYSSHISWYSTESPVPNELYPSLAFDSLFENRGSLRNQSILDRVRDRAQELSAKVSSTDKNKIDEYLTSVREVERRIEGMRKEKERADARAAKTGQPALTMQRPENGLPEDLREHSRLMVEIMAMAFQTDRTRIATLLLSRDLSGLYYPFLEVRGDHHSASHDDLSDGYERITRFHLTSFANLAKKLDAMPEGEGTVLDNCCLMFLSNMWAGWKHDNMKLPVVLAGGLGGTLQTARALDYLYDGDDNRKVCSLYLSLMDRFGVKLDRFGDAETRLAKL
ncbi:MAG TPA: DUF1552 domain-containing protein [Candidatus Solibacter sp.]|nr:DUF1552 domain-containing protein [Candidatus Solibacter sp.]